jgi:hypothetical protein
MISALDQLLATLSDYDPYDYRIEDVAALQLQAADECFQRQRGRIRALEQRAGDVGAKAISRWSDLLPLFFSDATYKSYSETLVERRNWKALGAWVEATSAGAHISQIDVEGVATIDDWLGRLRAAGQYLYVSSGTSGKVSMFHASALDRQRKLTMSLQMWRFATGAVPDKTRAVFSLAPSSGYHLMVDVWNRVIEAFGRPGAIFSLSDEPLRVEDVNSLGRLRKSVAAGTAAPSDISAFEKRSAAKQLKMQQRLERLADAVIRHRHEPSMFLGVWAPQYMLVKSAVERGLKEGVHPESIIFGGGGLKGVSVPADYKEQIKKGLRLDDSRYLVLYGMSELTACLPRCIEGRHHMPPYLIPIVVDKEGEHLVAPVDGRLYGRLGFFDLSQDGAWGAFLSGDRGTIDLNACPCGRRGPTVHDSVVRYADLVVEDDKVNCAGTIDAYVRGNVGLSSG